MSLRPLFGHAVLRQRLAKSFHLGRLPASLLLQGPAGVGKQRLALWLGQLIVCERAGAERLGEPCGECTQCRYVLRGHHPDVHWFYPRPRLTDPDPEDAKADLLESIQDRMKSDGLWTAPSGQEGIYMVHVRGLLQMAAIRPAMARRSVFIVGDAERMVSQASSPEAANAFLKLLEEPPPDTTIILTSSEPGALLPTIRSRVVYVRVLPLSPQDVADFLDDSIVRELKTVKTTPKAELVAAAAGAPGKLLEAAGTDGAFQMARRLLESCTQTGPQGASERIKVSAKQGPAGARGAFSDMLDALVLLLHDRSRQLAISGHDRQARRSAQGVVTVLNMKEKAQGNVSPHLLTASLVKTLHGLLTS